ILITDHNVTETLSICDRAYLLIEGKIYKHGTAEELAKDEEVKKLYLGRNFVLRRKDYLYESLKEKAAPTIENILRSLEDLRLQIIDINKSDEAQYVSNEDIDAPASNTNYADFDKYFSEVVNS